MNGLFISVSGEKDPECPELWTGMCCFGCVFCWLCFVFFSEKESFSVQWKEQRPSKAVHSICLIYYQHFCKPVSLCKMFYIFFAK